MTTKLVVTRKYSTSDFYITITRLGRTVRWSHNSRAIKVFLGVDANKRAKSFIRWLVKYLNEEGVR